MNEDIIVGLLTFLGTISGSYYVFRGQIARIKVDAEVERDRLKAEMEKLLAERQTSARDDTRDDFKAVTDVLRDQVKQLQDMVTYLRKLAESNESKILDLTRENGALREKVVNLEAYVQSIISASELRCPQTGEPCILRSIIKARGLLAADGQKG